MKKIFNAILLIIIFLLYQISIKADWVQVTNGLTQLNVYALTATGNYIFAGTHESGFGGGVFYTTNNGANWSLTSLQTTTLALASNGSYIYAGYQNGLGYSTNYGATWNAAGLGLWINAILTNGNYVYAGCRDTGVYVSTNYGANWSQTSLNNKIIYSFTLSGNYLFAGTWNNGIYLSTNNGMNWSQTSFNFTTVSSLASNGNYIYAGTSGVYLSTNYGTNWSQTSLNNQPIHALAVYGNNIFAAGSIFVSTDNGTNWAVRIEGMGNLYVNSLCISNGYIFAGTDGDGVWRRPLSELVGIKTISEEVPAKFELKQNYPNPFNPTTKIRFSVPRKSYIQLKIYDVLGRLKEELVDKELPSAEYELSLDGSNYVSGTYFYQLISGNKIIDTKKLVLIK